MSNTIDPQPGPVDPNEPDDPDEEVTSTEDDDETGDD